MSCAGTLAFLLYFSSNLYSNEIPSVQINGTLASAALANYYIFDGTRQGALLAAVCGIGAPLSETILMHSFGLWHYPRPDVLGLPSWVVWCYAFYTPALGNLARSFWVRRGED